MSLAEWSNSERIEYAIRYDAPVEYVGVVAAVTHSHGHALSVKASEEAHPGGTFKCTVVQRTVTYGEWTEAAS